MKNCQARGELMFCLGSLVGRLSQVTGQVKRLSFVAVVGTRLVSVTLELSKWRLLPPAEVFVSPIQLQ
jgi:hypothetical protein